MHDNDSDAEGSSPKLPGQAAAANSNSGSGLMLDSKMTSVVDEVSAFQLDDEEMKVDELALSAKQVSV